MWLKSDQFGPEPIMIKFELIFGITVRV